MAVAPLSGRYCRSITVLEPGGDVPAAGLSVSSNGAQDGLKGGSGPRHETLGVGR